MGDQKRQQIFEQNQQLWGQHESGAVLGATVFSDLTLEEFQALPIRGLAESAASGLPSVVSMSTMGRLLPPLWTGPPRELLLLLRTKANVDLAGPSPPQVDSKALGSL